MTRKDLVNRLNKEFGIPKKYGEEIVKFIFSEISNSLEEGERVSIQGFGSFEVRERKERIVYNPRTKERLKVPAKRYVAFIPSKKLFG